LENTSIRQCTVLLPTSEITEKVVVVNESKREGAIGISMLNEFRIFLLSFIFFSQRNVQLVENILV